MISSIRKKGDFCVRSRHELVADLPPARVRTFATHGKVGPELVARAAEVIGERSRSARRCPPDCVALGSARASVSAPQHDDGFVEAVRECRKRRWMSEGLGAVQNRRRLGAQRAQCTSTRQQSSNKPCATWNQTMSEVK